MDYKKGNTLPFPPLSGQTDEFIQNGVKTFNVCAFDNFAIFILIHLAANSSSLFEVLPASVAIVHTPWSWRIAILSWNDGLVIATKKRGPRVQKLSLKDDIFISFDETNE